MEDIVINKSISLRNIMREIICIYMSGSNDYFALAREAEQMFGKEACSKMWDELTGRKRKED